MELVETRDRSGIERFLRRDTASQLYALADLDDVFWPETTWFAAIERGGYVAVALLLGKLREPILYAVCPPGDAHTHVLLEFLRPRLPGRFFVNLGLGLEALFRSDHDFADEGEHLKYALADTAKLDAVDTSATRLLEPREHEELRAFYREEAYAADEADSRFLEPYMIERWPCVIVRERGRIVCAAGVHVLSDRYRVAALGNVATNPQWRGRGLARTASARLCRELAPRVEQIGLNVHADNAPGIRCYEALGFRPVRRYLEGRFTRRGRTRRGRS